MQPASNSLGTPTAAVGVGSEGQRKKKKIKKNKSVFATNKTGNPNQQRGKVLNRHSKELRKTIW